MIIKTLFIFISILYLLPLFGQEANSLPTEESQPDCLTLTLEEAISRALNYNRPYINQYESVVKAEHVLLLAQSEFDIKWIPNSKVGYSGGDSYGTGSSVGLGLTVNKKFQSGTELSLSPTLLKTGKHYYTQVEARISQPLLRGFNREYHISNLRAAQFNLRSACRMMYMAQLQLVIRTITALYDVVRAQKGVELNQESFDRITKFYQAAKLKEKIGLSDALDVYRAEIEWQQAQDRLAASQERLQESYDHLRDLLALPLEICLKVDLPLNPTPASMSLEEATQAALQQRIEMELAEDQWRESYRQLYVAKTDLYPDLNLVLDYSNDGRNEMFERTWSRKRQHRWGVGLETRGEINPVSDDIHYQHKQLAIQNAERNLEQKKAEMALEVKRALRHLQKADKKIEIQQEQIHTAEGQLQLALVKFDRGFANNFDVIQAEKTLHTALHAYWSALVDHMIGEYQFLAAIGLLTDKPQIL